MFHSVLANHNLYLNSNNPFRMSSKCCRAFPSFLLVLALMLMNNDCARADSAEEKQKCAEQLTGLATCLPYLGGDAKAPTPDCCDGLKQNIKNNKKCICLILNDRDDPDLGLKINLTLALGMPSLCKAPDNFSQCPALLHLDPKSAEAKAFNQLGQNNGSSASPAPSPSGGSSPSGRSQGTDGGTETSTLPKNEACCNGRGLLENLLVGLVMWLL